MIDVVYPMLTLPDGMPWRPVIGRYRRQKASRDPFARGALANPRAIFRTEAP